MVGVVGAGGRATVESVTSGAQTFAGGEQNLFGISLPKIFKKAAGFIPGIGPIIQELIPGGGPPPPTAFAGPQAQTPCPIFTSRDFPGAPCTTDLIPGPIGGTRTPVGAQRPMGDAVVGQFGVGMTPGVEAHETRVCLPGMQLGKDGLCYNKGAITNAQRAWPKGRKPLLTGGEMRAISTASRASKRLQGTTKRLQKMGMIPKPKTASRRRIAPPRAPAVQLIGQAID